jgi:hypothetical protein
VWTSAGRPRDAKLSAMRPWDRHPPWAHWGLYVVWAVAGSLGPIILIVSLLNGAALWWIGLLLCVVWVAALGIDWLLVRRLQRDSPGWTPWKPKARWLRK